MYPCTRAVLCGALISTALSCCSLPGQPQQQQQLVADDADDSDQLVPDDGWNSGAQLCRHHLEGPLMPDKTLPGPGLVYATADFNSAGTVLIKVQVEDLTTVTGTAATLTVWSGNGNAPAPGTTDPPPGGTQVYATSGNVNLRFYTQHLDRTYDPVANSYWLFVKVAHDNGDVRYMQHTWVPDQSTSPDVPHDFDPN